MVNQPFHLASPWAIFDSPQKKVIFLLILVILWFILIYDSFMLFSIARKRRKLRKNRMPTERHESAEVGHGFIELNSMIPETWWIPWWIPWWIMENNYQNISKHAGNFMGYWWILGIPWDINGKNGISSDLVTFYRFMMQRLKWSVWRRIIPTATKTSPTPKLVKILAKYHTQYVQNQCDVHPPHIQNYPNMNQM